MEKNTNNQIIRTVIQYAAMIVLLLYGIFRIGIPLVNGEPIYLDTNDGIVSVVCGAIALAVEVVKRVIARKAKNL